MVGHKKRYKTKSAYINKNLGWLIRSVISTHPFLSTDNITCSNVTTIQTIFLLPWYKYKS